MCVYVIDIDWAEIVIINYHNVNVRLHGEQWMCVYVIDIDWAEIVIINYHNVNVMFHGDK